MKFISMFAAAVMGLTGATSTPAVQPVSCVNITHTLTLNSRGDEVMRLQKFLGVKPTGFFGPMTQGTLTRWQLSAHVIVSAKSPGAGTTGPKTRAVMRCNPMATSTPPLITPAPVNPVVAPAPPPVSTPTPTSVTPAYGGSSAAPQANICATFTVPQPPAAQCEWQWLIIADEAGCPVEWDCSDPNPTE